MTRNAFYQNVALILVTSLACLAGLEALVRRLPGADVGLLRPSSVPGLAYTFVPNQSVRSAGDLLRINGQGFREDADTPKEKPAGKRRVLAVGDSITFGQGAGGRDYSTALEGLLPGIEVVNTGVPSYSTCQELVYVRDVLDAWGPDAVIVGYAPNDPEGPRAPFGLDVATGRIAPWWRAYHFVKQRLTLVKWVVARVSPLIVRLRGHAYYGPPVDPHDEVRYIGTLHDPSGAFWPRTADCIAGLGEYSRAKKVPVILAVFPMLDKMDSPDLKAVYARVAETATKAGLETVDLHREFSSLPKETLERVKGDGMHPTGEGHGLVAERLAIRLRKIFSVSP